MNGKHTRDRFDGPGFHDLRRTSTTALVVEGVDIRTAQGRLGHSDPRLTLAVYAQVVPEADRQAADRLAARFLPATAPCAMDVPSSAAAEPSKRPSNVVDLPVRSREGGI
ncbi:MAG: tyrosine-type recombinase/integrase [Acidimicrobiales bacterium]